MVMRQWQQQDPEGISDAACLGGLCHSIYGTQGFQGFAFPVEQRDALKEIIGERAEFLRWPTSHARRTAAATASTCGTTAISGAARRRRAASPHGPTSEFWAF